MTDNEPVRAMESSSPIVADPSQREQSSTSKPLSDLCDISGMTNELEEKLEEDLKDPTFSITELVNDRFNQEICERQSKGIDVPMKDKSVYDFDEDDDILASVALSRDRSSSAKRPSPKMRSIIPSFKALKPKPIIFDKRVLNLDTSRDLYKEGHLVWGKVRGYSYWPGVVTVDPLDGLTVKFMDGNSKVSDVPHSHIHFLGYDNQRAWLPESALLPYEGETKFQEMAKAIPVNSPKRKDFVPATKSLRDRFKKAIQVAESVHALGLRQRLDKLGFVYVPIERKRRRFKSNSGLRNGIEDAPAVKTRVSSPETKPGKKRLFRTPVDSTGTLTPAAASIVDSSTSEILSQRKQKMPRGKRKSVAINGTPTSGDSKSSAKSKKPQRSVLSVSSPAGGAMIQDLAKSFDEFDSDPDETSNEPKLGSLVWGRMAGFPFWPCFVTKNPNTGEYKRETTGPKKRCDYHVQFFNWNNESGWVSKAMPWCSKEVFQAKGKELCKGTTASNSEYKAWNPSGRMVLKWNAAFAEADKTASMTRRERHHLHVVFYRSEEENNRISALMRSGPHGKKGRYHAHAVGSPALFKRNASEAEDDDQPLKRSKTAPSKSKKPGPLSLKGAAARLAQQRKFDVSNAMRRTEEEESMKLPSGWNAKVSYDSNGQQAFEYHSPSGDVFHSLDGAVARLIESNGFARDRLSELGMGRKRSFSTSDLDAGTAWRRSDIDEGKGWLLICGDSCRYPYRRLQSREAGDLHGGVEYFKDETLPEPWVVKKTKRKQLKRTLRKNNRRSSTRKLLRSKIDVTGSDHPAAELEKLLVNYLPIIPSSTPAQITDQTFEYEWTKLSTSRRAERSLGEEAASCLTINLLEWSVEDAKKHPLLGRAVAQCFVDMVHLPDVFLDHPAVKVVESVNEMVISDLYTNDFIAKKIFYE